jgi:hypothetical protein
MRKERNVFYKERYMLLRMKTVFVFVVSGVLALLSGACDYGAVGGGCYPAWLLTEVPEKSKPFFGIYYRVINADCMQLANVVDLAALVAGQKYHTETATP